MLALVAVGPVITAIRASANNVPVGEKNFLFLDELLIGSNFFKQAFVIKIQKELL